MTFKNVLSLLKQASLDWYEDKTSRLAAALAYYTGFSIAPLLVICVAVAGFIMRDSEQAENKVVESATHLVGGLDKEQAQEMIRSAQDVGQGIFATTISILLLIWGASNVFAELQDSLNTIWEVQPRPDMTWWETIKKRFSAFSMVIGSAFVLLVSLIVSTALTAFAQRLGGGAGAISYVLDVVLSFAIYSAVFAGIFKWLPDVKIGWRDVSLGAVATALLFMIGKYLLSLYFTYSSATTVFGAAGSLAALLLWVYYSSLILFFGAEFTQAYVKQHGRLLRTDEDAIPVTQEARAQQGLAAKEQPAVAEVAAARYAPHEGPPNLVRIERPMQPVQGKRIAAAGVLAGIAVAAAGLIKSRQFARQELNPDLLQQRVRRIEDRIGYGRRRRRILDNMELEDRMQQCEHQVREAARHAGSYKRAQSNTFLD